MKTFKSKIHFLKKVIKILKKGEIIAYPTESVWGLGCDPTNNIAIKKLLSIKKRSWKKGFILVSYNYKQIQPYIDENQLTNTQKKTIISQSTIPTTWIVPAKKNISHLITGNHNTVAIRITQFKIIKLICFLFKKPIISTSANLHGLSPCKIKEEIMLYFKNKIFIIDDILGNQKKPSEIKDIITGKLYRKG